MTRWRDVRLLSRACAIFLNAIATSIVIVAAVARSTKYPSSKKPCWTRARGNGQGLGAAAAGAAGAGRRTL